MMILIVKSMLLAFNLFFSVSIVMKNIVFELCIPKILKNYILILIL